MADRFVPDFSQVLSPVRAPTQSPGGEDYHSEDDIDELFKQELSRISEAGECSVFGENSSLFGALKSTNLPDHSDGSTNGTLNLNTNHQDRDNGGKLIPGTSSKIPSFFGSFWDWSTSTYRWTRQVLIEGFGHQSKTVDPVLHSQIEALYKSRLEYRRIVRIVAALASHFDKVLQSQRDLANAFRLMSIKSEDLCDEFLYNAETQEVLGKNGNALLAAMKAFISGVETLCNRTMVDTLWTAKQLNFARIQYDALKSELDSLLGSATRNERFQEIEMKCQQQKQIYETIKENLIVKLKLLDENKVNVMHRQLESFHKAVIAYFSGNSSDLETALKQFNILPTSTGLSSWIEGNVFEKA